MYLSLTNFGEEVSNRVAIGIIVGHPTLVRLGFEGELLFTDLPSTKATGAKNPSEPTS